MQMDDQVRTGLRWLNVVDAATAEAAFLCCCGSVRFARRMGDARPFASVTEMMSTASDIWFNEVDINGWLQAFAAHPRIGGDLLSNVSSGSRVPLSASVAESWSEIEQSGARSSADARLSKELTVWNKRYDEKFGHVFLIFASGKSTAEVLAAIQSRYPNSPIDELQLAASEQHKITSLRLNRLLQGKGLAARLTAAPPGNPPPLCGSEQEKSTLTPTCNPLGSPVCRRMGNIEAHLAAGEISQTGKQSSTTSAPDTPKLQSTNTAALGSPSELESGSEGTLSVVIDQFQFLAREDTFLPQPAAPPTAMSSYSTSKQVTQALRPPITTHILDVAAGAPAQGVVVKLDVWTSPRLPSKLSSGSWETLGLSATDSDGRSGPLMLPSDFIAPGTYRLTFETAAYFERSSAIGLPGSQTMGSADSKTGAFNLNLRGDEEKGEGGGVSDEKKASCLYPYIYVVFEIKPSQTKEKFHIPLLLSPFSYTTYRGS